MNDSVFKMVKSVLTAIQKTIVGRIPEAIKQKLYCPFAKTPLLSLLLKNYIQKTSPVCLISFKKTGRTWLNVLIGKALQLYYNDHESDILRLPSQQDNAGVFPGVIFIHDDSAHWKKPGELIRSKSRYKFKKIILLVRDPRDVVVSLYFEKNKRLPAYIAGEKLEYSKFKGRIVPYCDDISKFIHEPVGSFETIIQFYNIWAHNKEVFGDGLLLVRYEDLQETPQKELLRVMNFLGLKNVSNEIIEEAVTFASFRKMQAREQENVKSVMKLRPADVCDKESYKARKGKIGGFADYLSSEDIKYLEKKMKSKLSSFYGYKI